MKFLPIALLVSLAVVFVCADDQSWKKHKSAHGISDKDEPKRRAIYDGKDALIQKHNRENPHFKIAHNQFSHMTEDEIRQHTGLNQPTNRDLFNRLFFPTDESEDRQTVPATYDLRVNSTCVNPIKNQGQCGSCWAFSATATVEFAKCKLQNGVKVVLSEQQLVDCANSANSDPYDHACNGGHYVNAWYFYHMVGKHGAATSATYGAYTSGTSNVAGTCKQSTAAVGATITGYAWVSNTTSAIQNAILTKGVVSAGITVDTASTSTFMLYKSGLYTGTATCNANPANHAVNLVGWTVINGINAWIMRNSWATTWGDQGYMYIKFGACHVEQNVAYAVVA